MSTERTCRNSLERFFAEHPDTATQQRALKAFRLLTACEKTLRGNPEGWAAGIIYWAANNDRRACGVPGVLNSEVEAIFRVSMDTVRRRAAQVERLVTI